MFPNISNGQRRNNAGQALVEMTLVTFMLVALLFGLIDFGRAIMMRQIVVNISREAANLASRGTDLTNALKAVTGSAKPLNINANGYVILTVVTRNADRVAKIVDQEFSGGVRANSKIGMGKGNAAILPNDGIPAVNQTLVAAEVFYRFAPITPIGKLLGIGSLSQLYDVAYF
jgi:Flp pilus assembly protein TadG